VFLQEGELLALLLAEQVTRQYLGTPLSSFGMAARRKPSSTLTDPEGEGSNARLFRMGEPL